jgi:hypothetical protein
LNSPDMQRLHSMPLGFIPGMAVARYGGSRESECQLFDTRKLVLSLGATYQRERLSFLLPPNVIERLRTQVKALQEKQQGKSAKIDEAGVPSSCGNPILSVSQRNASVPPEIRKRGPIY